MDLVVLPPPWIPEDDLLLKNSVEAGASLESLAKGAVRFSRKYSITELRDRWQSLLYDPDVAAEASASMANLELSGKSAGSGVKEGGTSCGEGVAASDAMRKRAPSIRNQYYAMRKRLCRQVYDSSHMASHDEMIAGKKAVNHVVAIADNSVDEGRGLKGKYVRDDVLNNAASAAPVLWGDDVLSNLSRLADSQLNLANEDEVLFMDVDGKDGDADVAADNPCYENVDSLLLSSPCEVQGNDDASDICESRKLDTGAKASSPSHLLSDSDSDPGNSSMLSVSGQSPCHESNAECTICLLSTEDPVVPSNDSADFSVVVPPLLTMKSQPVVQGELNSDSCIDNQRKKEPGGRSKKEDNPSKSFALSQPQLVKPGLVPNVYSSYSPAGVEVKGENAGMNHISPVSKQTNNVKVHPNDRRLVQATDTMVQAADGHRKQKEIDAPASVKVGACARVEEHKHLPESEVKSLLSLNQEGGGGGDDDDNDDDDDYDNEVPSFSDAEAMILEMDLCPADQDTHASREVLRYQHDETKRTIMRLEQCAQSFMQRAIASRAAFAVLYGRNMKQYINKSEVILGRGTDDLRVDIDLRKEGCANKISRRQALIKMEANGSFIIKNLGKSSIFLNGNEIATGQLRGLSASCLIEIRGLSFIFETNNKSVRSFLQNMHNK